MKAVLYLADGLLAFSGANVAADTGTISLTPEAGWRTLLSTQAERSGRSLCIDLRPVGPALTTVAIFVARAGTNGGKGSALRHLTLPPARALSCMRLEARHAHTTRVSVSDGAVTVRAGWTRCAFHDFSKTGPGPCGKNPNALPKLPVADEQFLER